MVVQGEVYVDREWAVVPFGEGGACADFGDDYLEFVPSPMVHVCLAYFGCGGVWEGYVVDSGSPFGSGEGGAVWIEGVGQDQVVGL